MPCASYLAYPVLFIPHSFEVEIIHILQMSPLRLGEVKLSKVTWVGGRSAVLKTRSV